MRCVIIAIFFVCFAGTTAIASSGMKSECAKAYEYLEKKGEVNFKFKINNRSEISKLTHMFSIDRVEGNEVWANANRAEFDNFLKLNLDYEVQVPPGDLLKNPKMSDFEDKNNREWDYYPTYQGYLNLLSQFETDYPGICKVEDLGPSGVASKNHRIYAVKISDNVDLDEAEPGFIYSSAIHGDEVLGFVTMLHFIDTLLSSYSTDTQIKQLVDNIEIWILPLNNPDGTYYSGDNTVSGAIRRNVADNFDLNRNFPCPCESGNHKYYGLYSYYAKETQAIINFENQHSFVLSADLHGGTEVALWPFGGIPARSVDENWFKYIAGEYRDTVHKSCNNNGYFTSCGGDGIGHIYTELYECHGILSDSRTYFRQCRSLYLELSIRKLLDPSDLLRHWEYNYRSLFNFMRQVFYGINGAVTDTITVNPLEAKVFIENHEDYHYCVYSRLLHGDYYRPIIEGTYNVTFSCDGYYSKTISDVTVANNSTTVLNVELIPFIVEDSLRVESPNGGEQWARGGSYNILWWSNISENVKIELLQDNSANTVITTSTPCDGSFLWNIPSDFPVGSNYSIRITSVVDPTVTDVSDADFTITAPSITVTSPNGGETLFIGTTENITWTCIGVMGSVKILYSTNNGADWFTVVSSTGNDGIYSWTVPDAASTECKIQISDAADGDPIDESDAVFSIAILPAVNITSPNGGEKLIVGSSHNITWTSAGAVGNVKIDYSTDNGSNWTVIEANTENDGVYAWLVPGTVSTTCKIRVSDAVDGNPVDISDNVFTIEPAPSITVTSPNGGEILAAGSSVNIYWSSAGTVGDVKILFSPDSGSNWYTVISSTANDGSHPWTVPDSISIKCLIQVSEAVDGDPVDESDAVFTIEPAPVITVTAPNGGETWFVDSSYTITWTTTGTVGNVKIEYSTDGGTGWNEIVASTANDSTHQWTVKAVVSTDCKIKISEASDGTPTDESDAVFTIEQVAAITDNPNSISLGNGFRASPNPVETGQEITFYFTPAGKVVSVELKVYDQVGNIVFEPDRISLYGISKREQHTLALWDLRNVSGRKVGGGTYLALLLIEDSDGRADVLKTLIGIKDQ